jgi:hypothetical protein
MSNEESKQMDINAVRNEMIDAAKAASDALFRKYGSTDMIGACGFAWVTILPKHKGNTKSGKAERKILTSMGFRKDWTGKAYELWNPSGYGGQNVDIKEAGADAAAQVLKGYGFNAYAGSRLD